MARAWEKVKSRRPKPRARTPIPIRSSACSRLRKAIGALDGGEVHKAGASVLKFEKGEYSLPAEDRTGAQESRLCQAPEREAFRLGEDPLSQGVDRHLRLFLRLPHPDIEVPALDLLLPDHDDVRNPFFLRRPDFLRERVVRIVKVGANVRQAVGQASGEFQ